MNLAFNKKLVRCVKNDFAGINNINLSLKDTVSIIKNFAEFSKLIILLEQRRHGEGPQNEQ